MFNKSDDYWRTYRCPGNYYLRDDRSWQYRTMVTAMDSSIGKLLNAVKDMGEEDNTIIVFTSDNGPEDGAGSTGLYHGRKRSLREGGIRVPAIVQWVGKIPAGRREHHWIATIDLVPTFLEAARVTKPSSVKWDGLSFLSMIVTQDKSTFNTVKNWITGIPNAIDAHHQRVFLWHKVTEIINKGEPPNRSSAHYQQIKVVVKNDDGIYGCVEAIYDHKYDHYEDRNVVANNDRCDLRYDNYHKYYDPKSLIVFINPNAGNKHCDDQRYKKTDNHQHHHHHHQQQQQCLNQYNLLLATKLSKMLQHLRRFALYGRQPYLLYVAKDHDNCNTPVITRNSLTDIDTPVYYDTKNTFNDDIKYSIPLY